MMPTHYLQLVRFEEIKRNVCKEIKSFEEKLKQTVTNICQKITYEMLLIKCKLEEHRKKVREKLEEYVKKIGSDLANLKRWNFQYVHNDLYEIEYRLGKIEGILSRPGYFDIYYWWYEFIRTYASSESDNRAFVDFFRKLYEFRRQRTTICGQIETIRGKINVIRSKLNILQLKIPNIRGKQYKDQWRLRDKIKDFKVGPRNLMPAINSMNIQIGDVFKEFKKIQEKIKPLQESIKPIETKVDFELVSDIKKTILEGRLNLEKVINDIADLGMKIKDGSIRLEKSLGVSGYLSVIDPKLFAFEEPGSVELGKIETLISGIKKNTGSLDKMDGFIKLGFRKLRSNNVLQFVSDDIRDVLLWFEKYILSAINKLKEELQKYIETLQSIKSIYEQLKEIKYIVKNQGEAMKKIKDNGTLDIANLEKIKPIIEEFVKITSNIDKIVSCFDEKNDELKPIKDNITYLKSLRTELWKLEFSINSDIMFARTIEKIIESFKQLKQETENFSKVESVIANLIKNIGSIIKTLGSICCIIESICCMKCELIDLGKLKPTIDDLKIYLERLGQCNKDTDGHLNVLSRNILYLQEYTVKLCNLESIIKGLEMKTIRLPIIELFPELLFALFRLDFMTKCHTLHQKIRKSIKCSLDTIQKCRLLVRIIIFQNKLAGVWVTWVVKQIKEISETIRINITEVELVRIR